MSRDLENGIGPELIDIAQETIGDEESRKEFYRKIIKLLSSLDSETLDDALGIDDVFDEIYDEINEEKSSLGTNKSKQSRFNNIDDGLDDDEDEDSEEADYFRKAQGDD